MLLLLLLTHLPSSLCGEFGTSCFATHNALRRLHKSTNDLVKSTELEALAVEYANQLEGTDTSVVM